MKKDVKKDVIVSLGFAGCTLLLAVAAKFAHAHGYIDGDASLRIVALNGLLVAYLGNRVPKRIAPHACARQAMRFSGWSLVLSGLVYTGFWLFAPIPVAAVIGTGAVAAAVVLTIGYCLWLDARQRSRKA